MTELVRFSDHVVKGRWARVTMTDGQPCFIAIGPRSLVVKRSKTGIIGPRLLEIRRLCQLEKIALLLEQKFSQDLTPAGITNPLLKPIVNAALHCSSLDDALTLLSNLE